MANRPRSATADRVFNDLRNLARREDRTTDELIVAYVLERWLYRMSISDYRERLVLKGGLLLAALDARRATRDGDLLAHINRDMDHTLACVCDIARIEVDDGVNYQTDQARASAIREADQYGGVRVTMPAAIGRTRAKLALDISFGDPITPGPSMIAYPSVLPGERFTILGYPVETVLSEKIVTAVSRGDQNTRDRDWADIWRLTSIHRIEASQMLVALRRTAAHRAGGLAPLMTRIGALAEERASAYVAWRRKQGVSGSAYPPEFGTVLREVLAFTEPLLSQQADGQHWVPTQRRWIDLDRS